MKTIVAVGFVTCLTLQSCVAPPRPPETEEVHFAGEGRKQRNEGASRLERAAFDAAAPPAPGGFALKGGMEPEFDTETYSRFDENPFLDPRNEPLSTFSIDVDTASYANVRRFLREGKLPPKDAVRIEELLNAFVYDDPAPSDGSPFSVSVEAASCPWSEDHTLARIALKGEEVSFEDRKPGNYVFLIDVSGSMRQAAKLPLVKEGLKMLASQLRADDRVAIVVYAGAAGLVLPATPGSDQAAIVEALERLEAGGSTAGGAGIELAYAVAAENFVPGGINRVILATDGDFNVGASSEGELTRIIEEKAGGGVFLTVVGFGTGNLKDSMLEKLADRGNGSYAYVDSPLEARRLFVEQAGGTLVTIAKDVKIQVEFNPRRVAAYRLIGYENRLLAAQDFNDDAKDAGEIGAGHSVVALYEIVPAGTRSPAKAVDPLKYQTVADSRDSTGDDLMTVKLRYKDPDGATSRLIERVVGSTGSSWRAASTEFEFSAAVAAFGMILRDSPNRGSATFDLVRELAEAGLGVDSRGRRGEFVALAADAERIGRAIDVVEGR